MLVANRFKCILIGCLLILANSSWVAAEQKIVLGVSEIPFLLSRGKEKQGAYNQVLKELEQENSLDLFFMPPARAEVLFDKKEIDCLFPASKTTIPNADQLIQSDPLTTVDAYIFSIKEYPDLAFFENKTIAIRRGFSFGNIRDKLQARYVELENEQAALAFLQRGRADAMIGYLPDVLGAQKLLDLPLDELFYHDPIYSAQEAVVCHSNSLTLSFIENANQIFSKKRQDMELMLSKDYIINVAENIEYAVERKDVELMFSTIYSPLGIRPKFVYYPSLRGLSLVDSGDLDADAGRFIEAVQPFQNLVQVPSPVSEINVNVFCLKRADCENKSNIKIGALKGLLVAREHCAEKQRSCVFFDDYSTLVDMLAVRQIDAIMSPEHLSPVFICASTSAKFYYSKIPELSNKIYHYVGKSNEGLVSALSQSIADPNITKLANRILNIWKARIKKCDKNIIEVQA